MHKIQRKDIYGVMQCWIMTVKDHSTGLMFCVALPNKRADFVAHELEKYFGLVGYHHIFHTDNGKEFTAFVVADLLKANNPTCAIVTGHPRTPRDQGSVESGNKIFQRILKSIQDDRVQAGLDDNWTSFLGQVTSCCNNQASQMLNSVTLYKAVFGQDYTQASKCSITELMQCRTIWDCLKVSPDDRIAKFVTEELSNNEEEEDDNASDYFSATKHDDESVQDRKQPPEHLVEELVDEIPPQSGVNTTVPPSMPARPVRAEQSTPVSNRSCCLFVRSF